MTRTARLCAHLDGVGVEWRPRDAWTDRPSTQTTPYPTTPDLLVWHHLVTPLAPEIPILGGAQSYHMDTQGWFDIAYQLGVGASGIVYLLRGPDVVGGATGWSVDRRSISVGLIGDYTQHQITAPMVRACEAIAGWAHTEGIARQEPHQTFAATSCSGGDSIRRIPFPPLLTPSPPPPSTMPASHKLIAVEA